MISSTAYAQTPPRSARPSWTRRGRCASPTSAASPWPRRCTATPGSCPTTASRPGRTGDVAIVQGPAPYTVADDPGTRPTSRSPRQPADHGGWRRHHGPSSSRPPHRPGQHPDRLHDPGQRHLPGLQLRQRPPARRAAHRRPGPAATTIADHGPPADEVGRDEPGQQVVLDRLLDLALIATCAPGSPVRAGAPGLVPRAWRPLVGRALRSSTRTRPDLDGRRPRRRHRGVPRGVRPPLRRPGRPATDDLCRPTGVSTSPPTAAQHRPHLERSPARSAMPTRSR